MQLIENNRPSQEVLAHLSDSSALENSTSFQDFLQKNNHSYKKIDYEKFLSYVENSLIHELEYFCFLLYFFMEQSDSWGDAGQQQVKVSFCRNLLNISPDEAITSEHGSRFHETVTKKIRHFNIFSLTIEQAKEKINNFSLTWLDKDFSIHDMSAISDILAYIGSSLFLQGGYYGSDIEFILGQGTVRTLDAYKIVELENEILRTPNTIVAMAAIIGDMEIIIRHESLNTIFHQKWASFNLSDDVAYPSLDYKISDLIKLETIKKYGICKSHEFPAKQKLFVHDMKETILFHEIGHGIIQYHTIPHESGAIAEATKVIGENILTAFLEFLADFAPTFGSVKGPVQNMIDISKTDHERAQRLFFMYLSDTWFFDTTDTYMYLYSDMVSLSLSSAITKTPTESPTNISNYTVNFGLLESIVGKGIDDKHSIVTWIVSKVQTCSSTLKEIIENTTYTLDGQRYAYSIISKKIETELLEDTSFENNITSYKYKTAYWSKCFEYVLNHSKSVEKINKVLDQQKNILSREMFNKVSKKLSDKHDRDFVFNHLLTTLS